MVQTLVARLNLIRDLPSTRPERAAGMRMIVVEDHQLFREGLAAQLQRWGCEVVGEASDGASGLRLADALAPEAVRLDIGLPDADGFDVCEELADRGIPMVLMSIREQVYRDPLTTTRSRGFIPKARPTRSAAREFLE